MTLVVDLLTLSVLAKFPWDLVGQHTVSGSHFALIAPAVAYGVSVVVLMLFAASLHAPGVAAGFADLAAVLFLLYLVGRIAGASARPVIEAVALLSAGCFLSWRTFP